MRPRVGLARLRPLLPESNRRIAGPRRGRRPRERADERLRRLRLLGVGERERDRVARQRRPLGGRRRDECDCRWCRRGKRGDDADERDRRDPGKHSLSYGGHQPLVPGQRVAAGHIVRELLGEQILERERAVAGGNVAAALDELAHALKNCEALCYAVACPSETDIPFQ